MLGPDQLAGALQPANATVNGLGTDDGRVARSNGVDVLLVRGPKDAPFEVEDVLARALSYDELAQRGYRHTAT